MAELATAFVNIEARTKKLEQQFAGIQKTTKKTTSDMEKAFSSAFTRIGVTLAATFVTKAISGFVKESVKLFNIQEEAEKKLAAVIASTGGAAEKTAQQLYDEAAALQSVTKFGDEAIINAQTIIATFKNIKGDNFTRVTEAAADMATVLGTDLKSASIQLGKALNDPATQLSALSRSGVTFSEVQKEMVKDMVKVGDIAGAQTLILDELESQFGGAAQAAANTFGGSMEQLGNIMGDIQETIGGLIGATLTPLVALMKDNALETSNNAQAIRDNLVPAFEIAVFAVSSFAQVMNGLITTFQLLQQTSKIVLDTIVLGLVTGFESAIEVVERFMQSMAGIPIIGEAFKGASGAVTNFREGITKIKDAVNDTRDESVQGLTDIADNAAANNNKIVGTAQAMFDAIEGASRGHVEKRKTDSDEIAAGAIEGEEEVSEKVLAAREKATQKFIELNQTDKENKIDALGEWLDEAKAAGINAEDAYATYISEVGKLNEEFAESTTTMWDDIGASISQVASDAVSAWLFADDEMSASTQRKLDTTQEAEDTAKQAFEMSTKERAAAVERGASDEEIARIDSTTAMRASELEAAEQHNTEAKEMAGETAGVGAAWEAAGSTAEGVAGGALSKAADAVIEKMLPAAASALGMGGGTAAGVGEAEGGFAGAAKEVGIYLGTAALAYGAAKLIAKRADGGPIHDDMGVLGLISQGTHGRADDVQIRSNVLASKGEFVMNKVATARNLSTLHRMNATNEKFADGGQSSGRPTMGGRPSGPNPNATADAIGKAAKSGLFETGSIKPLDVGASQEAKAVGMADNLIVGSSLAFVRGWLEGGDQYTGIGTGIAQAIRFVGMAAAGAVGGKLTTKLALANGGVVGDPRGAKELRAFPEVLTGVVNAMSGGSDCPGCGKDNRRKNFERASKKRFKFAEGGTINTEGKAALDDGGTSFDLGECIDLLSNPAKMVSQFWDGVVNAMRAPLMPIAREMVSPDIIPNISTDVLTNSMEEIYNSLNPENFLGACSPFAKGGVVNAPTFFRNGGGMGVAGEAGPEAIMPLQRDSQGNLGVSGGGGGITLNLTIEGNMLGNEIALREFAEEVGHQLITLREDNRVPSLA